MTKELAYEHKRDATVAASPKSTGPFAASQGTKLGYLIGQAGYFHEGHRAVDDCFALLEVLDEGRGKPGRTPFAEVYASKPAIPCSRPRGKQPIRYERSSQGARLSLAGRQRWSCEVLVDRDCRRGSRDELRYLRSEIYRWDEADPPIKRLTTFDRFKS